MRRLDLGDGNNIGGVSVNIGVDSGIWSNDDEVFSCEAIKIC
ncbi:unnamed protein product, partial [Rotaria magnacalcarata]